MRFSLLTLLLVVLVTGIYLAGVAHPTVFSSWLCDITFAASLIACSVVVLLNRLQRGWEFGFACTGIVATIMVLSGTPMAGHELVIDRFLQEPRRDFFRREMGMYSNPRSMFDEQYVRSEMPSSAIEQLKKRIVHSAFLYGVSLLGALSVIVSRKPLLAACWLPVVTFAVSLFDCWCLFQHSAFWCHAGVGITVLAFIVSIPTAFTACPSLRRAFVSYVVVGGTSFVFLYGPNYLYSPEFLSLSLYRGTYSLYLKLVPERSRVKEYYINYSGRSEFDRHSDKVYPREFEVTAFSLIAAALGTLAAYGALELQHCCSSRRNFLRPARSLPDSIPRPAAPSAREG